MSQIVPMIMDALVDNLTLYCITNEPDERARPRVIQVGQYQGDHDVDQIVLSVHPNDPFTQDRDLYWRHQVDRERRTIGHRTPWRRRFTIRIICNFSQAGYNQQEARELAHTVLKNVENCVDQSPMAVGPDSKGERVVNYQQALQSSEMVEAGGNEDNELLWYGTVWLEYLTETRG